MRKYIEIKMKMKTIIWLGIIFLLICISGGYYIWCSYHPQINIQIGGPTGKEEIIIETPLIAIMPNGISDPDASIYLKINQITMQHEFFCTYIKDTYKTSDIKLDIKVKDNETVLVYYGIATTIDDKTVDIEKEFGCGFLLDAKISNNS